MLNLLRFNNQLFNMLLGTLAGFSTALKNILDCGVIDLPAVVLFSIYFLTNPVPISGGLDMYVVLVDGKWKWTD